MEKLNICGFQVRLPSIIRVSYRIFVVGEGGGIWDELCVWSHVP